MRRKLESHVLKRTKTAALCNCHYAVWHTNPYLMYVLQFLILLFPSCFIILSFLNIQHALHKEILRKCHQVLYPLHKLRSFDIARDILTAFYYSFIESTLTPSFTCWFNSFQSDPSEQHSYYMLQNHRASTVFTALSSLHDLQTIQIAHRIQRGLHHILYPAFEWLRMQFALPNYKTQKEGHLCLTAELWPKPTFFLMQHALYQ